MLGKVEAAATYYLYENRVHSSDDGTIRTARVAALGLNASDEFLVRGRLLTERGRRFETRRWRRSDWDIRRTPTTSRPRPPRPVWSKIPDPAARHRLIEEDREFLRRQLAAEHVTLVLMNGRTVIGQVAAMGVQLQRHCGLPGGRIDEMLIGTSEGTRLLGWNRVFPSGGISTEQRARIVKEIQTASQSSP